MSYNSKPEEIEKVEYNLSGFKIGWIAQLIEHGDRLFLRGHPDKKLDCWKLIYNHIRSRLAKEERIYCHKTFLEYDNIKYSPQSSSTKRQKARILDKYENALQFFLKKYGFDMKEREDQGYLV